MKPDWCPQGVWDSADTWSSYFYGTGLHLLMARAIMEEREACVQALISESEADIIPSEQTALRWAADIIRNRP